MSKIEHFAVFTNDLETLKLFYTETFGMKVIVDNSKAPVAGYFLADDAGAIVEIIARPARTPAPDTRYACHIAFLVGDYEASRKAMQARGAKFETETEVANEAMKTGFFNDPAGNRVQIVWRALPLGS